MKFSLVVCTYMRPKPLLDLLESVRNQTVYPNEIVIVDGSTNKETQTLLTANAFQNLHYFLVDQSQRGLTKQRNFGVSKVQQDSEIICFLDDDTVLEPDYFEEILNAFQSDSEIVGVGGSAINENFWKPKDTSVSYNPKRFYEFEGYVYPEGLRNVVRNYLGLQSHLPPGRMPEYSHGKTCGFPLTDKIYEVDLLIGMSFSFKKTIFDHIDFSTYFEGYGLYEDADFSIKAQRFGKNVITTKAQLSHYHNPSGRPNQYQYGKMVVRNGWYVWRLKYPKPSISAKLKWNAITLVLAGIRLINVVTTSKRKEAFTEFSGRMVGWFSLFLSKPKRL
ncbi:glycosyltransferase family 2 protein [Flavobacterium sp.]|uniref:glycosyltransferase family 2 protein n=1 Tax=Flavobacterium sp. TaxID=239 RepID=UPI002609A2DD|nr:glycosyltransferase [Flavobacterium sp.]